MLKIFSASFNQNIKFSLLQLIEEIVLMLSGETLKAYLQPHLFSGFVISTMKSNNYTWIEICLRIMLVLTEKKVTTVNLSLHREGIQDYLSTFGDKKKLYDLTGVNIDEEKKKEQQPKPEKLEKDKIMELFADSKFAKLPAEPPQNIEVIAEDPEKKELKVAEELQKRRNLKKRKRRNQGKQKKTQRKK